MGTFLWDSDRLGFWREFGKLREQNLKIDEKKSTKRSSVTCHLSKQKPTPPGLRSFSSPEAAILSISTKSSDLWLVPKYAQSLWRSILIATNCFKFLITISGPDKTEFD